MNGISGEPLSHAGEDRERGEASWNRRGLFTSLVGALSARAAAAQSPPGVGTARGNRRDEFYYIVNHATFGYTPQEYAMALQLGYDAWLDRQLSPAQIPDLELDQILAGFPTLNMSYAELLEGYGPNGNQGQPQDVSRDLTYARIHRAIKSNRHMQSR